MIEEVSTKPFAKRLPEGRHMFRVIGVPQKKQIGKAQARTWMLLPDIDGVVDPVPYDIFAWEQKELLLVIGFEEDRGQQKIVWDDEKVDGKEFSAEVYYAESKKINPNTQKPYLNMALKNFEAEIAF